MEYEEPILIDLEDLDSVSGGGCATGGSATGIGACADTTEIAPPSGN